MTIINTKRKVWNEVLVEDFDLDGCNLLGALQYIQGLIDRHGNTATFRTTHHYENTQTHLEIVRVEGDKEYAARIQVETEAEKVKTEKQLQKLKAKEDKLREKLVLDEQQEIELFTRLKEKYGNK